MAKQVPRQRALREVNVLAKLMDAQFRIPGTRIRFGLDSIVGLVPGVGDVSSFAVPGMGPAVTYWPVWW